MLWHRSATWWALVLAIAFFFLSFPVSLAANILTPHIRNWWAERSARSLRVRIEALRARLSRLQRTHQMTSDAEHFLLVFAAVASYTAACLSPFISLSVIITLGLAERSVNQKIPGAKYGAICLSVVVFGLSGFLAVLSMRIWGFVELHSPIVRRKMQRTIGRLESKLTQREGAN